MFMLNIDNKLLILWSCSELSFIIMNSLLSKMCPGHFFSINPFSLILHVKMWLSNYKLHVFLLLHQ